MSSEKQLDLEIVQSEAIQLWGDIHNSVKTARLNARAALHAAEVCEQDCEMFIREFLQMVDALLVTAAGSPSLPTDDAKDDQAHNKVGEADQLEVPDLR